jgi:hypothetical protein
VNNLYLGCKGTTFFAKSTTSSPFSSQHFVDMPGGKPAYLRQEMMTDDKYDK